jgi:molybdenum cofactor cytidylyltransferase
VVDRLIERFSAEVDAVVPCHRGRRGAPVLFARRLFGRLEELTGDEGGRRLLAADPTLRIAEVELANDHALADIDTIDDYRRLCGGEKP